MGMFSGVWGQFTQGLHTNGPKPPCLAEYCHHKAMNPVDLILALQKLPPKPLPPLVANVDTDRCTTPPFGMEGENWYLLVITTSIDQLSLGPGGDNPEQSSTDSPRRNMFQSTQMAAVLSGSTRVVSYGGATMKELKKWGENRLGVVSNQKTTFGW